MKAVPLRTKLFVLALKMRTIVVRWSTAKLLTTNSIYEICKANDDTSIKTFERIIFCEKCRADPERDRD